MSELPMPGMAFYTFPRQVKSAVTTDSARHATPGKNRAAAAVNDGCSPVDI
jgi:hypothetical protein